MEPEMRYAESSEHPLGRIEADYRHIFDMSLQDLKDLTHGSVEVRGPKDGEIL